METRRRQSENLATTFGERTAGEATAEIRCQMPTAGFDRPNVTQSSRRDRPSVSGRELRLR